MVRPEDLRLFLRVAALGSFSRAAREAGILPGQVSAAIQRLETRLNTRLFARSTRSLRLSAEGEKYLPYAQEILSVMQAGEEILHQRDNEIRGTLRIALPSDCGRNLLLPWISDFCSSHRELTLQLSLSDHMSDIFRDPVDIAIRYGIPDNRQYIAQPLAEENRRVLVASPDYLARCGQPHTPEQLAQHTCLLYSLKGHIYDKWAFPQAGGMQRIALTSQWLCDDADVVRRWAVAGHGIAYKSWIDVSEDVVAGRLKLLLTDIPGEPAPLYLICPHRKEFSPAIRLLRSELSRHLQEITGRLPEALKQASAP